MNEIKLSRDNYTVDMQLTVSRGKCSVTYSCFATKVRNMLTNSFEFVVSKGSIPTVGAILFLYEQDDFLDFVLEVQSLNQISTSTRASYRWKDRNT